MADVQRCIAAPALPSIKLPLGIGFTIPGISISFNPKFCCKLPTFKFALPPIPINALIFAPIAKALAKIMALINKFIALLAIPCPRF